MSVFVTIVIVAGAMLGVIGFAMAFRQTAFRRLIGQPRPPASSRPKTDTPDGDPLTYILRISGVMMMVFGLTIAGMVALFNTL